MLHSIVATDDKTVDTLRATIGGRRYDVCILELCGMSRKRQGVEGVVAGHLQPSVLKVSSSMCHEYLDFRVLVGRYVVACSLCVYYI